MPFDIVRIDFTAAGFSFCRRTLEFRGAKGASRAILCAHHLEGIVADDLR